MYNERGCLEDQKTSIPMVEVMKSTRLPIRSQSKPAKIAQRKFRMFSMPSISSCVFVSVMPMSVRTFVKQYENSLPDH